MHGIYWIKVVRDEEVLFEYGAPCHPLAGQLIKIKQEEYLVSAVGHVLKLARNGFTVYHSLDYVEVKVY